MLPSPTNPTSISLSPRAAPRHSIRSRGSPLDGSRQVYSRSLRNGQPSPRRAEPAGPRRRGSSCPGPDAAAPELRQNLLLEAAIGPVKAVERQLDGAERIFVRQTEPAEVRTV